MTANLPYLPDFALTLIFIALILRAGLPNWEPFPLLLNVWGEKASIIAKAGVMKARSASRGKAAMHAWSPVRVAVRARVVAG